MIQKLVKEHERFKMYKIDHQYSQLTHEGVRHNKKVVELRKGIQSLLKDWPRCVHNQKTCEMPKHPSCIQVLDTAPQIVPPEESPTTRSSYDLRSLVIQVELLLGNKPKYGCVQECQNEAKKIKAKMSMEKAKV